MRATLEDVGLLVSNLRALATPKQHASALAILRKAHDGVEGRAKKFTWIGGCESEPEAGDSFLSEPEGWQRAGPPCARGVPSESAGSLPLQSASSPEPGCGGRQPPGERIWRPLLGCVHSSLRLPGDDQFYASRWPSRAYNDYGPHRAGTRAEGLSRLTGGALAMRLSSPSAPSVRFGRTRARLPPWKVLSPARAPSP
jgi:hypothetical protein